MSVFSNPFENTQTGGAGASGQAASGWGDWQKQFGNMKVNPTAYEQQVQSGEFLNLDDNKYFQDYVGGLQSRMDRNNQRQSAQALSPFAAMNNFGSGMNMAVQGRLAGEQGQMMNETLSGAYMGQYDAERNRQQQVADLLSGRQQAMWGTGANLYGSDQARKASMYGSDQSRIASMYGSDKSLEGALAHAAASRYGSDQSRIASMYGADQGLAGARAHAGASRFGSQLGYNMGQDRLGYDYDVFNQHTKPLGAYYADMYPHTLFSNEQGYV